MARPRTRADDPIDGRRPDPTEGRSVSGWLSQPPICPLTTLRTFVACEARVQVARGPSGPRLPGGPLRSCPPERAPPVPPPLLRSAGHPAAPSNRQPLNAGMHAIIVGRPGPRGALRSEVKEETAAVRPTSGDMSGAERPADPISRPSMYAAARTATNARCWPATVNEDRQLAGRPIAVESVAPRQPGRRQAVARTRRLWRQNWHA